MACVLLINNQESLKIIFNRGLIMKSLISKKIIICILSISAYKIFTTPPEYKYKMSSALQTNEKIIDSGDAKRNLASEENKKIAKFYFPINETNNSFINSEWEITRIVGSDEKVKFDKLNNPEDEKKEMKVNFKLIGNGVVQINNDSQQTYEISLVSNFDTIALFKKIGNGYEILEAKRLQSSTLAINENEETELILERALNQNKSNKVLEGDAVSGHATIANKKIKSLNVELNNTNGELQSIDLSLVDIEDGGAFKTQSSGEEVSGVIFNNGKDGYRISFVTGPLAGAMLNFVTSEQKSNIENANTETENENNISNDNTNQATENIEAQPSMEENNNEQLIAENAENSVNLESVDDPAVVERKEVAENPELYHPVRMLSSEEIKDTVNENGFSF